MADTRSTCPYCGVGCGVVIESDGPRITGVRGDPDHPANFGRLCTKGSTLHLSAAEPVARQTRLLSPMRRAARGGALQAVSWDAALDEAAQRFAGIAGAHGPDAVGFYVSGQLLTEDYYVFNKLAKGLLGTNNIDTNSRLCMSSAVAGYKRTLGADAPPACYDDLGHAQCLFIAGSNTAWAHPVLFRRIEDARRANPTLKIIVADPRRTDTCEIADLHLPLAPGSDVMLFNGMLRLMLQEGWTDPAFIAAHTTGFDALARHLAGEDYTPERVAQVCGIGIDALREAARLFATSRATLSLYCQGLNQSASGTDKNAALIHLHLATGQIGRAGAGPFSLTGQPNAMGGREVGGLANLLSGHRDLANPAHRAEVAALWGVPQVPATPGKTAIEMFQAAADGELRALWIACTNPAQSLPDQATVRRALERCEFVVLQEAFATTATAGFADLLLPATTWGEKDGTVTNSERRVSRVRAAVPPPGQARHDWAIATDFARRLARRLGRASDGERLFPYATPQAVWNEHRESTRGRDLDITGMSYAMLEHAPRQWPLRAGATDGRARLYEDHVFATEDGRAHFVDVAWRAPAEAVDPAHPYALNTGRLRDQWHGMSRTGTLGRLFGHAPQPCVQMHPADMAREGLAEGELARVRSRRGEIMLPAAAQADLPPGQAFIAMHWGGEFLGGRAADGSPRAGVNALTNPAFCPRSKQPELKHAAVSIDRAGLPWSLVAMAWMPADRALDTLQALRALMVRFDFASCVPFGAGASDPAGEGPDAPAGVLLRAAAAAPADDALLARIEQLIALDGPDTLRYTDRARGQRRAIALTRPGPDSPDTGVRALLLAGDTRAESWVSALLQHRLPAQAYGRQLLAPGAIAPAGLAPRGKVVCNCLGVGEAAICAHLAGAPATARHEDDRLAELQASLRCGTQCGSCVPELRRMVRAQAPLAKAA